MPVTYGDPYSFLFGSLWDVLEDDETFASLVKSTNRIKLDDKFKPFKSSLVEASVPEVTLLPAGKVFNEENPCDGTSVKQTVHATVVTGLRNTSRLFPLQHAILTAIYNAIYNNEATLMDLEWEETTIIKQIIFLPIEEGLTYDELNREIAGWSAIMPMEVKMFLPNTILT